MSITDACLKTKIQSNINAITSNCCSQAFVQETNAITSATSDRQISIATANDLPDLLTNYISPGQTVYVESLQSLMTTDGFSWYGLDGRKFRQDASEKILYVWGKNSNGQLGDGTTTSRSSPVTTAAGGNDWKLVAISSNNNNHALAIRSDNKLWGWGINSCGQLGNNTIIGTCSPIIISNDSWAAIAVSGRGSSAGVKTDGTLWTWGRNYCGILGDGTTTSRSSPGTIAGGGTNWSSISFGYDHSSAIKTDGTLWTWGRSSSGVLGSGNYTNRSSPGTTAGGGTNWCQSSSSYRNTAAIKTDGTLWTWGRNNCGQLGDGTTTVRQSPVTTAGGGTNWCKISAGVSHMSGIKTDGTLWTWGINNCCQLGDGAGGYGIKKSSPGTTAGGGTNWCVASAGCYHSAGVKTDGTLWTWGGGTGGALGIGSNSNRSIPTQISLSNWSFVVAGECNTAAIRTF